jgi:hypothetical protein
MKKKNMKTQLIFLLALSTCLFILSPHCVSSNQKLHFLRDNKDWSPSGPSGRRDRIVLIAGHLRSFEYTKASIAKHLVEFYDADIGLCMTTVSHSKHDESNNLNDTLTRDAHLISGWMEDRVIFKEFLPDFAIHNTSGNYATHDHLPIVVDHSCPTGCSRSGATPLHLPISLMNPPPFPRSRDVTDTYERSMFSQLYAWYSCFQLLVRYENVTNHTYTTIIRHRSDVALWADYPLLPVPASPSWGKGTIYIPDGDNYNGVNDRMWISDRAAARVAFNTLLVPFMRTGAIRLCPPRKYVHSPEANLLDHLTMHHITIDRSLKWEWSRIDQKTGCIRTDSDKLNTTKCLVYFRFL